ncbi:hypothetical protein [Nannocystis pusilla]|uniref:hypothetical protein n=1 Tax=Nannocystis pusilla TaxID=889268 RepID=UPI003B822DD1
MARPRTRPRQRPRRCADADVSSAAARQLFDRFRDGLQEPARPQAAPPSAAVSAEVIPTAPPAAPEQPELPRSPIVGRIQLPTYPAAAVAEARETLEEILKDIQDMRPDFALMSPRYQKVYMLAWISARAASTSSSRVSTRSPCWCGGSPTS